jgi:hypothetical protein
VKLTVPGEHLAPVRSLAAVIRQPGEERREVGVGGVALERDGVAAFQLAFRAWFVFNEHVI